MRLPIVSSVGECGGCTRRDVLSGLGVAAASLLVGCKMQSEPDVDGMPPIDSNTNNGVTMCGSQVCVDLANPATAPLAQVNGSLIVIAPGSGKRLILVRTSDTDIKCLSDVCTHAGCSVRYDLSLMHLRCPCHGSQFALDGSVLQGPAALPLKTFATQFDSANNTLTITLA